MRPQNVGACFCDIDPTFTAAMQCLRASHINLSKNSKYKNSAARCILQIKKCAHITPVLQQLHWLPVKEGINFKVLLLTWKALYGMAPVYIKDRITPSRHLRSSEKHFLEVPSQHQKTYMQQVVCGGGTKSMEPSKLRNIDNNN